MDLKHAGFQDDRQITAVILPLWGVHPNKHIIQ